jgi:hypothetical protein
MRLYANGSMVQWRGTQAEAKAAFATVNRVDVPTDKLGLLEFLNNHSTGPEAAEVVQSKKPESVEDAIIRVRADKFDRENTPTVNKGIRTKRVVCYLEYDAAADEVTNVQMVSQMQLAQDDFPSWDKLDQQLSKESE